MQYRRQGDERVPLRHWLYLAIVVGLMLFAQSRDYEDQKVVESMTKEQVERIALDRTRTLVACAQSRNIIVGDKLIECRAIDIPVREMNW